MTNRLLFIKYNKNKIMEIENNSFTELKCKDEYNENDNIINIPYFTKYGVNLGKTIYSLLNKNEYEKIIELYDNIFIKEYKLFQYNLYVFINVEMKY